MLLQIIVKLNVSQIMFRRSLNITQLINGTDNNKIGIKLGVVLNLRQILYKVLEVVT